MRIVHIALYGPVTDGWNYQDNMIPKYQVKAGHDVAMIASKWVFNQKGKIEYLDQSDYIYDGVRVIRLDLKIGKDIYSKIKYYRGLYEQLELLNPECIFIHNVSFLDIAEIKKYAKKHEVKIYADNHNDFSNSARNWVSKKILHGIIWKRCAQLIEPYTTKFYGVLPARVDFLRDVYGLPKNKTELLVMGADDELVESVMNNGSKERIRKRYDVSSEDFLLMTGGKIDAYKTQTLLLMEVVNKIKNTNVKLIVFGSVSDELKEKINELCNVNKVQYIGWINAEESYEYFAAADLVVFPGRHSVFWEQVAGMGIPMLCKYWDGTTHVDCGGNVQFLYKDSVDELQEKIETLIDDKNAFQQMCKKAKESQQYFSYKDIAARSIEGGE